MRFYLKIWLFLAAVAVCSPSCSKKVGCPANADTTPKFDGSKQKKQKTKSGIYSKTSKHKRRN